MENIAKGRRPNDLYVTPQPLADQSVEWLREEYQPKTVRALDPGRGFGAWGLALRRRWDNIETITGIDLVPREPNSVYNYEYTMDYLAWAKHPGNNRPRYNLIVGNPPFSLANEFVLTSLSLLEHFGVLMFLLRDAFLAGQWRQKNIYQPHPLARYVSVVQRPSFTEDGHSEKGREYGLYVWIKGYTPKTYHGSWLNWR